MARDPSAHWRITRFVVGRRRLLLSSWSGLVLVCAARQVRPVTTRFILAWDLTTTLYVSVTLAMISRSTIETATIVPRFTTRATGSSCFS